MSRWSGVPLFREQVISLGLAWAACAGSIATGVIAILTNNDDMSNLTSRSLNINAIDYTVDEHDIIRSGAIIAIVCIVIYVWTSNHLRVLFFRPGIVTTYPNMSKFNGVCLAVFSSVLLGALATYDYFVDTRGPVILGDMGGFIDYIDYEVQRADGSSVAYRARSYLVIYAIIPWLAVLFTLTSSVLLWLTGARVKKLQTQNAIGLNATGGAFGPAAGSQGIVEKSVA